MTDRPAESARRVTTMQVGRLKVHALETGIQRLDGGAMFGVVPKPLWERRIPADERNRIRMAMRVLLIEHDDGLVLVDCGLGNKEPDKFLGIYGIENRGANGRTQLEDVLAELGHRPNDIKVMLNTHLHFDHAGGNTWIAPDDAERRVQLTFPNAQYVVHATGANTPGRPTRTSALRRVICRTTLSRWRTPAAIAFSTDWSRIGRSGSHASGHSGAHAMAHGSVLIQNGGDSLLFPADTIPTAHHLPLAWIMGYDVEPMRTLESKRQLYQPVPPPKAGESCLRPTPKPSVEG